MVDSLQLHCFGYLRNFSYNFKNINFIVMVMEYKIFRLANLRSPDNKQVNLSALAGDLYIGASYLAIDLWFMHSNVAKAAYFMG